MSHLIESPSPRLVEVAWRVRVAQFPWTTIERSPGLEFGLRVDRFLGYTPAVSIREFLFENFAGDLEYHPRRAVLYLCLGLAAACFWIYSPSAARFTAIPLVFALGSLTLFLKGLFLLRKSSEGLGLSEQEISDLSASSKRKGFPSSAAQAAQVLQDFGTGPLLLWPLLNAGRDIDSSWTNPPRLTIFLAGAVLFGVGWTIRKAYSER